MLTIIVPMAGHGSRFSKAGYIQPKPLIPIHGVPMIQLVIQNLRPTRPHHFIFICQKSHVAAYDLECKLNEWTGGATIVTLDQVTEGAACTVLTARDYLNPDQPIMIANSDQYIDIDINTYLEDMDSRVLDGSIMTMEASDPKWSFAAVDATGIVTRVEEKHPISSHATVGIYSFRRARDYIDGASSMIAKGLRVNGEFYVAPVYNELVERGRRIGIYNIGSEGAGMYGLGIPTDLNFFTNIPLSQAAVGNLACK